MGNTLVVLAISEYKDSHGDIVSCFTRIGRAFHNDSGSISLDLTALPIASGDPPRVRCLIKEDDDDDRQKDGDRQGNQGNQGDRGRDRGRGNRR